MNSPVIVFVYRRLEHTKRCIEALERNMGVENTDLFVYCDQAKTSEYQEQVNQVREYIDWYSKQSKFANVTVKKAEHNLGLANSIIFGVTEVISKYGKAIIVEDDILTREDFLLYMNGALDYYEKDLRVGSINAFVYDLKGLRFYQEDVFATKKGDCWGWATWQNRWEDVDWLVGDYSKFVSDKFARKAFDELELGLTHMLDMQMNGKIDSWAVRWVYHLFKKGQISIYPSETRTINIGLDGSGTNCKIEHLKEYRLENNFKRVRYRNLEVNTRLAKQAARYETKNLFIYIYRVLSRDLFWISSMKRSKDDNKKNQKVTD